jgi:pyruvate,water dikinase
MKFTKTFNQINKNDADIAGGKGASLGEMTQTGIPVPEGFVILADAFNYFLEKSGLIAEVESELNKINFEDPNSVEETSERLRGLIEKIEVPMEIVEEIKKSYVELSKNCKPCLPAGRLTANSFFVAVRSSATAEDSSAASWAGELESYLFTNQELLITNIKKCWSSLFTPRAIFYRHEKGMIKNHVAVAVVVQRMINSDVSGITFTVHPVSKDSNQMIIEAGWGLGEAIVGGMITPDDYIISKFQSSNNKSQINSKSKIQNINYKLNANSYKLDIVDVMVSEQEKMIVAKKDGGVEEVKVPSLKKDKQKLSEDQILEIAEICQKIEDHYGFPCDIEWAFEKSKFYIVQSRPITTL